jgi:hypothetical protein
MTNKHKPTWTDQKMPKFKPVTYNEKDQFIDESDQPEYDLDERESMREWEEDQGIHDDW